jgi:D-aminopeptidase
MRTMSFNLPCVTAVAAALCLLATPAHSGERARDLGIIVGDYEPGKNNAITDVAGVRVGHVTLIEGEGKLVPGKGPVRTGVTAIIPADGDIWYEKLPAGSFILNGNGEATGLMWLNEQGALESPIVLTNTLSVSDAHRGLVDWMIRLHDDIGIEDDTVVPVVLECDDSALNDVQGRHVKPEHVLEALDKASGGPVVEGSVGAGTGMMTYEFKGGIGTASRVVELETDHEYTIGVLVNANHGERRNLRILGAQVGKAIDDLLPELREDGSIIVIIATDAPLDSRQLSRLAKRAMLGLARTGGIAHHWSGDVAVAFSTANRIPHYPEEPLYRMRLLSDAWINELFEATADAAEEAIINAMLAAETVVGRDGNTAHALPHDRLKALLPDSK